MTKRFISLIDVKKIFRELLIPTESYEAVWDIELENLKERGIKWISEYDSSTDEQKQTTKENYGDEAERLGMIIGNDGITFH